MGYWNAGILVQRDEICFYMDGTDKNIKSNHYPLFVPDIPFFHHSINPEVN